MPIIALSFPTPRITPLDRPSPFPPFIVSPGAPVRADQGQGPAPRNQEVARMDRAFVQRLVRNFHENGLKLLLEQPANVRDTLAILRVACVGRIDFEEMRVDPAQFVQADYRHLASDL